MYKRFVRIIAVSLVAMVSLASCQAVVSKGQEGQVDKLVQEALSKVSGEPVKDTLTASGTIQADQVRISSVLGGRIASVRVAKGQEIRARETLVVLDSSQIEDKLAEMQAAIAEAEAELALVRAGPRAEEIAAAEGLLSLAQAERDGAMTAWQNAQDLLANPQALDAQIVEAQTRVKLAEQAVSLATAELEKAKLLAWQKREGSKERQAADLQVTAYEEALSAAEADRRAAQTALDWLWQIRNRPLGLIAQANAAEGQVQIAEAGVVVAQTKLDDLLAGPTENEIAVAEANVRLAEAQAEVLEANRDQCTLTSPVNGVVLNQTLRVGELAAPAATILNVADLSSLTLTVYVPVDRLGEVALDQNVQVVVDSFSGRVFAGQVLSISNSPEFMPRNVATEEERLNTVYAVEIQLDNTDGMLKPGMPADATFLPASGDPS
jgi:HlyD family secretion protein